MDNQQPQNQPQPPAMPPVSPKQKPWQKINKKWLVRIAVLIIIALAIGLGFWLGHSKANKPSPVATSTVSKSTPSNVQGLQLDSNKNYGNKYANGILPVGDGKYSTTTPAVGTVYVCGNYANNLANDAGGAGSRGPWFIGTTQYNLNKKISVQGSVKWQESLSNNVSGTTRTITSNDLPANPTGVFPISATDPAYAYDKNPNTITAQSLTYSLPANPTYGNPSCEGGQVGVMLTNVALFNGFDAGGRDAGAWEVQDSCQGHPQSGGIYHYHTLSSCIKDISVKTVIGFALDGFPITGPQVGTNNYLTTADLDVCHGITSQIVLDGKTVTMYHYVMTQDFPYSVSCYRGTAITPPGQQAGTQRSPARQQAPPAQ